LSAHITQLIDLQLLDVQWQIFHAYDVRREHVEQYLKTGGELRCSGRASSSCSTSDTRRVNLVTNPVIQKAKRICPCGKADLVINGERV
jgi:hypothetical protein